MKRTALGIISALSSAWLLLSACSSSPTPDPHDLSRLLPNPSKTGDWQKHGEPGLWEGEDLYIYINGGAEIYQEYGFQRIMIQDFKNPEGSSISLEIYEMTDSPAAYGIFTFKTSSSGKNLNIGQGGQIEDYYLNFWQDRYLFTLTGFDQKPETIAGLKQLAETITERFEKEERGDPPSLANRLPRENLLPTGSKYFRGHLGLFNSYPFSQHDIFQLREAFKGRYFDGYEVYLIPYANEASRREVFQSVQDALVSSPNFHDSTVTEHGFQLFDGENTLIRIEAVGTDIVIVTGCTDSAAAKEVIINLRKHLGSV